MEGMSHWGGGTVGLFHFVFGVARYSLEKVI